MDDVENIRDSLLESYSALHSDEVDDIIGRQPAWIVRWGITVLSMIILGIILACCIIRYPQIVTGTIRLTSENPSADLTARYAGILDSISVSNGDTVSCGQLLSLVANAARYEDVLYAENSLDNNGIEGVQSIANSPDLQLGDVQSAWLDLKAVCQNLIIYMQIDQIGKKKRLLAGQIRQAKNHIDQLLRQRGTLEEELSYERKSLERDSTLFQKGVISVSEYENSTKAYLVIKNTLDGFEATLSGALLSQIQLEQQLFELDVQRAAEESDYWRAISQSKEAFRGQLSLWKEQYAIISPFDGTVSLQNVWSKGQHVNTGDLIASVNPVGGTEILGRLKVPSSGFGKVSEGQEVNIKLNGFPYLEFGILKGYICSISTVPEKAQGGLYYTVDVSLTNGLESTYHKLLPFVQDMDGTAEIITEDMFLIEYFIRPIRSLFINN